MANLSCLETSIILDPIYHWNWSRLLAENYTKSKVVILVDENTHAACLSYLFTHLDGLDQAEIIELPAGEESKTMEICVSVWERFTELEIGRNDLLICLGGGMICDLGGFVASVFKRGMHCLYIPTSLLAMVDASVGGKTGVDFGQYKNQIGTFSSPDFVLMDPAFLTSLPNEEMLNGFAEMLKHALIADAVHFQHLKTTVDLEALQTEMILNSLTIKTKLVEQDPMENGIRKKLNFGHTVGHALEGYFLHSREKMAHGLAVAHGMLVESRISVMMGLLAENEFREIQDIIKKYFQIRSFKPSEITACIRLMQNDKKRIDNKSRFTLLTAIGKSVFDVEVDNEIVEKAFVG